jgi:hypothetical protein
MFIIKVLYNLGEEKMKICLKALITLGIAVLFIGLSSNTALSNAISKNRGAPSEVFVDDDYDPSTPGWGYDHFDNIQNGIDNVSDSGTVHVYQGTYDVFKVIGRSNILIESMDATKPIVQGNQNVLDHVTSPPIVVKCVIFVDDSVNIDLMELNVQGVGLTGRSYAVFYNDSTGSIDECNISPNQKGNMASLGIRAQLFTELSIENCTILNYGRIGIYGRSGTILEINNNMLYGQIYTNNDGDYVSYGIEVEDLIEASHATIRHNEIFNHDHTGTPTWSSAAIIIDAWRYYEVTPDKCSAIIEYNDIHDNMIGVQIVPNSNIKVNLNKIHDNTDYGAVSDPYWDGTKHVYVDLNAKNNWWGDETGPFHPSENPSGIGDEITDYVEFNPWKEDYLPGITITQPKRYFLYFNFRDLFEFKIPFITTLIIGKIDVKTEVTEGIYPIEKVEFFVDDNFKSKDETIPYEWSWDEVTGFFPYKLRVVVYDVSGNTRFAEMNVWKTQSF